MNHLSRAAGRGREQVSAASAAVFRIGFGIVGLVLVARFFAFGWIEDLYLEPAFHFTYPGFAWVRPLPGAGMYLVFGVMGVAAAGIALGWRYRISCLVFGTTLAYAELIDRSLYLNHYYWAALTALVISFLPLAASASIDARAGRVTNRGWVPLRVIWALRFQVGMVYFFAGLAKLNADWLVRGEPLATWLPARSEMWLIGPLLTLPVTALALAWGGALFDLTIVGWLSWRRSRPYAYAIVVVFHTATWLLFPMIGVFPLLMSIAALVFFEPDWPERVLGWRKALERPGAARPHSRTVRAAAAAYLALMLVLPLRHYLIPGDVKLTGEGYLGSWQVMLSEKSASTDFLVTDVATGEQWRVPAPDQLTPRQQMVMATDPVMLRQAARLVADQIGEVEVSAVVTMSFNGRRSAPASDPATVLASNQAQ